ncbi:MAG TPA: L-threonylcarbamoyladenylate synthase [Bacteroidota bacterium]|nr:L-threonylcarbamoyladenylate synthase [Bacteroidota bacterium]
MKTRLVRIDPARPDPAVISEAVAILARGGLVAFPTETVYGLGANAVHSDAVRSIFAAKGRPADNPLIVHIADIQRARAFAREINSLAQKLIHAFWPGPLTLVLPAASGVLPEVTSHLQTVAIRMPRHAVPLALAKGLNGGIVAPSANLSGLPSPTLAQHVLHDLEGAVDLILDGGVTEIGLESTVLDLTQVPPLLLRAGGLTVEQLTEVAGPISRTTDADALRRSPGTRYRHYAPRATVLLVGRGKTAEMQSMLNECVEAGKKIGIIAHSGGFNAGNISAACRVSMSEEEYPRGLYRSLRELDEKGVDIILVEAVAEQGLGTAVMERLRRAAKQ